MARNGAFWRQKICETVKLWMERALRPQGLRRISHSSTVSQWFFLRRRPARVGESDGTRRTETFFTDAFPCGIGWVAESIVRSEGIILRRQRRSKDSCVRRKQAVHRK